MSIKKIIVFLICMVLVLLLIATYKWLTTEQKIHSINYTAHKQQFCQLFYENIVADSHSFDLCYKHPASAIQLGAKWYWLDSSKLQQMNEQDQLSSEQHRLGQNQGHVELIDGMPIVYLTFDDGPGKYTDRVLDILKEENIKATFFVLGVQAERNPLFTKRIVEEGHTLGNHTYDHDYKKIYRDFNMFAEQVSKTNRIVHELTAVQVKLFRAPGGSINNLDESYFTALREAGFKVFDWNVDSRDSVTRGIQKNDIVKNIVDAHLYDPAIVLLHDTNSHEQSMLALSDVIAYYREQGYQFAALNEQTEELTFRLGKNLSWTRDKVSNEQIDAFKLSIMQLYEDF